MFKSFVFWAGIGILALLLVVLTAYVLVFFLAALPTGALGGKLAMAIGGEPAQMRVSLPTPELVTRTPFQPLPTSTVTPTPLPPTETPWPTPTLPPTETEVLTARPTVTEEFPPSQAQIEGVYGYAQSFNLDCEARSAVDLAAYFGLNIGLMDFLDALPRSDDPEVGFVGRYTDPRGQIPPNSYGVHAGPVADLLRQYGLNAEAVKNSSWERLRAEIASGRPVMVWVINNTLPGWPVSYTASSGNTTTVAHFEHTVILTGYSPRLVTILDGDLVYQRTISQFLESWAVLENMAVLVNDPPLLD